MYEADFDGFQGSSLKDMMLKFRSTISNFLLFDFYISLKLKGDQLDVFCLQCRLRKITFA
jgi:hypothetical protein